MSPKQITDLSIAEIARSLRNRSHSSVEVVAAHLDLIDRLQPILNAFAHVDEGSVVATAKRLDRELKAGRDRGPLHGVPVAVKDLIAVANTPMRAGSSIYRRRPTRDADIVAALRAAGAVVLGLTRLHEIALGPTGLNPHDGGARNPRDLGRIPGGSSSGSAVAVAAGLAPLAVGTDTGGSVRIPAALCGVVGLKPTYGVLSTAGVMPLATTLDHVGLLARTVGDIEAAMRAIGALHEAPRSSLAGLRVGVLARAGRDLQPSAQRAYDRCLGILRSQGARLVDVDLPSSASIIEMSSTILFFEAYRVHRSRLRADPKAFGSDIRQRLTDGRTITTASYRAALRSMADLRTEGEAAFATVSVIVSPTVPTEALTIAETGQPLKRALLPRNTRLFNVLGSPAISLPAPSDGLPIGLQVAAAKNADAALLSISISIEHAFAQARPDNGN